MFTYFAWTLIMDNVPFTEVTSWSTKLDVVLLWHYENMYVHITCQWFKICRRVPFKFFNRNWHRELQTGWDMYSLNEIFGFYILEIEGHNFGEVFRSFNFEGLNPFHPQRSRLVLDIYRLWDKHVLVMYLSRFWFLGLYLPHAELHVRLMQIQ